MKEVREYGDNDPDVLLMNRAQINRSDSINETLGTKYSRRNLRYCCPLQRIDVLTGILYHFFFARSFQLIFFNALSSTK